MATIRQATLDDLPAISKMAERFYPESPYPAIYGDMPEHQAAGLAIVAIRGWAEMGIEPGVMLVAEADGRLVGMLCLHVDASTFAPAVIAAELVWWVEPEHRGGMTAVRLIKAGEQAAKERGAQVMNMSVLSTSPREAGDMLGRLGYAPSQIIHTKRLT